MCEFQPSSDKRYQQESWSSGLRAVETHKRLHESAAKAISKSKI